MEMPCLPVQDIDDFAETLLKGEGRERIPLSGSLELTLRCNNRCVHCYCNKGANDTLEKSKELSSREICHLLDEIAESGCLWLLLTGGEPLLREDFETLYTYAKKKGFLITLFTNGTLITPRLADLFQDLPPRSIEITLYGMTDATYERMTRTPGSYKKCRQGIDHIMNRALPLKLKTVVTTVNRHEFVDMKQFVEDLELEFRFDALINSRIDDHGDVASHRIAPEEVLELDLTDPRRGPEFVGFYERASKQQGDPEALFRCGAGVHSFHIDPHGRLMLCNMARTPSYDLRRGSFRDGWHGFLPLLRKGRLKKTNKCVRCDLRWICDQCPGWAQLECGDPEIPVEYLCEVAHLRAAAYGIGARNSSNG